MNVEVRDGKRIIKFQGTFLATASSARPHTPRYVVLSLYALPSPPPAFVLSRVGHSRVFHTATCRQAERNRLPFGHEIKTPLSTPLHPCPYCAPVPLDLAQPDALTTHRFETPRYFGAIAPTASDLMRLLNPDPQDPTNPAMDLPWLSRALLDQATTVPSPATAELQAAYNVTIS